MKEKRHLEMMEKELLEWKEKQFLLRKKYSSTPAGFENLEALLSAENKLRQEKQEYHNRKIYGFLGGYEPEEERFVGREQYLKEIDHVFLQGNAKVVLYGIGGIGKTALARAYVKRVQQSDHPYDEVLFLSYNMGLEKLICDDVQLSVANLCYSRDKYGSRAKYFTEKLEVVRQLARQLRLLLILDDCNMEKDKRMAEVFSLPCQMLVTTRRNPNVWEEALSDVELHGIQVSRFDTEEEWDAFFHLYQPHPFSGEEMKELIRYREQVHGHTLLMMLKIQGIGIQENGSLSEDRVEEFAKDLFCRFHLRKDEKQALCELAIMPVQGIEEELYYQISNVSEKSVENLANYLLVRREGGKISLHPIIAKAVKKAFCPGQKTYKTMVKKMKLLTYHGWNQPYLYNQRLEPYVFAILKEFPKPLYWQYQEYDGMTTLLWIQGHYKEAQHYCKILFETVEEHYGEYHQVTVEMALRVAAAYYNAMDFKEAHAWYVEAYRRMQKSAPFDDRFEFVWSVVCAKLSREYRYRGQFEEALVLIEEALGYIKKYDSCGSQVGTKCHCILNKARILWDMERFQEAWELGNEVKKIACAYDKKTGKLDNNEFDRFLIKMMLHRGEYDSAEKLARNMVEKAEVFRHRTSKEMLSIREHLAEVWKVRGKYSEALKVYEEILEILEEEFPYQRDWIARIRENIEEIDGLL